VRGSTIISVYIDLSKVSAAADWHKTNAIAKAARMVIIGLWGTTK
jgi:hypothetical protein